MQNELDFDHHLSIYRHLLTGNDEQDAPLYREAEEMHALRVNDALIEVMGEAITVGQSYSGREAAHHLTYGLGRRLKFIWLSVRSLVATSPPDRTQPMTSDDVETVARDLNVIYINIRGALDNLAAALPSALEYSGSVNPMNVDLFKPKYLRQIGAENVNVMLDPFRDWAEDLARRRNPAAHRIPLSVPPKFLDSTTRVEYERAMKAVAEAQAAAFAAYRPGYFPEKEFEAVRDADRAAERIGVYAPVFVHHPDEGIQAIYPLVATDIGKLLQVTNLLTGHLKTLVRDCLK